MRLKRTMSSFCFGDESRYLTTEVVLPTARAGVEVVLPFRKRRFRQEGGGLSLRVFLKLQFVP
jgi:hypothetical protein